jgi:hypothetical protein
VTIEPASALPVIVRLVARDGDGWAIEIVWGATGAAESCVKLTGSEQSDVLPAASVAVEA